MSAYMFWSLGGSDLGDLSHDKGQNVKPDSQIRSLSQYLMFLVISRIFERKCMAKSRAASAAGRVLMAGR